MTGIFHSPIQEDFDRYQARQQHAKGIGLAIGITLGLILPRRARLPMALAFVAFILMFFTFQHNGDPQSDDPAVFNASGTHATIFTWLAIAAIAVALIKVVVECVRHRRHGKLYGTLFEDASVLQQFTGMDVFGTQLVDRPPRLARLWGGLPEEEPPVAAVPAPAPTPAPVPAPPAPAASKLVVPVVTSTGKVYAAEDHDDYVVNDRRRFAKFLDD